jgi:hypothetical protein
MELEVALSRLARAPYLFLALNLSNRQQEIEIAFCISKLQASQKDLHPFHRKVSARSSPAPGTINSDTASTTQFGAEAWAALFEPFFPVAP